jgi:hypothetical protein
MIQVTATRLTAEGSFSYSIEAADLNVTAADEATATVILEQLGVENPQPLIAHSRSWGMVEIATRSKGSIP